MTSTYGISFDDGATPTARQTDRQKTNPVAYDGVTQKPLFIEPGWNGISYTDD